jgi:magnesium-transporting ATPase (P-type)
MAVQYRDNENKLEYFVKGSLEALLPLCKRVCWEGEERLLQEQDVRALKATEETLNSTNDGCRCLYFAMGTDLNALQLVGWIAMSDPPR